MFFASWLVRGFGCFLLSFDYSKVLSKIKVINPVCLLDFRNNFVAQWKYDKFSNWQRGGHVIIFSLWPPKSTSKWWLTAPFLGFWFAGIGIDCHGFLYVKVLFLCQQFCHLQKVCLHITTICGTDLVEKGPVLTGQLEAINFANLTENRKEIRPQKKRLLHGEHHIPEDIVISCEVNFIGQ